jgi:hypothetical protein
VSLSLSLAGSVLLATFLSNDTLSLSLVSSVILDTVE